MTQLLDPLSDRPLALQLADLLRTEIQEGHRRPGSQLPDESEFLHAYGAGPATVEGALATLASEGLVQTYEGAGWHVMDKPPLRRVSSTNRHAWRRGSGKPEYDTEAIAQGQVPSRRVLTIGRAPVPADIAGWLGVETGAEVVVRQRLQFLDGVPAVISASYFPLWVAGGTRLESADLLSEGPGNVIEELGHEFASGVELIRARMPEPDEARLLGLGPGIPVVRLVHVDYDAQDRTLQVAADVYAGDRHEFAFEWAEPDGPVARG